MGRFVYYLVGFGPLALGLCFLAWSAFTPLDDQTHSDMVHLLFGGVLMLGTSVGMRAWVKRQGLARW